MVLALFFVACWLSVSGRSVVYDEHYPRAGFNDAKPTGGKGLRLVLEQLGYQVKRHTARIATMPADARAWILLDPKTGFSRKESWLMLQWLKEGGTLVWALPPQSAWGSKSENPGITELGGRLKVAGEGGVHFSDTDLPSSTPLTFGAASDLRSGVRKASGSGGVLKVDRPYLELAGNKVGVEIGVIPFGKGRIIVLPDALLCTNYGLSKVDNAVLVTNFIRVHAPTGGSPVGGSPAASSPAASSPTGDMQSGVYFDERQHGDLGGAAEKQEPTLLYYITHGPAGLALLQLLVAGLLMWGYYGRRLGAPVPIPDQEPVTRAGQFALAMGLLFRKANRPRAAAEILGEEFRRALARRLGMSPHDPDAALASAAERATGLPARTVDRLLLKSRNPANSEAEVLTDAQDMVTVLRHLDKHPHL